MKFRLIVQKYPLVSVLLLLSLTACTFYVTLEEPSTSNCPTHCALNTQPSITASPTFLPENTQSPAPTIPVTPATTSAATTISTGVHQTPNECIEFTPTPEPSPNALLLEVENYNTDPQRYRGRRNASNNQTVSMLAGENLSIPLNYVGNATMLVRYSNDSAGALEVIELRIIGQTTRAFSFSALNTRRPGMSSGDGWECFQTVVFVSPVEFFAEDHTLEVRVTGGDGFGVELDGIVIQPQ